MVKISLIDEQQFAQKAFEVKFRREKGGRKILRSEMVHLFGGHKLLCQGFPYDLIEGLNSLTGFRSTYYFLKNVDSTTGTT